MSEIRTLLLTDVVDSTRLAESLGDEAMAQLWEAHDRLARDLLAAHGGREIDKTDGLLLLFDRPADAAGYALAYHRALAALPQLLRARAGIHHGPVILRENRPEDVARGAKPLEVDGLAKPMAARVMSLARGGQTLLSADARRALGTVPLLVQSHGHWAIKGVAEPQELFELGEPGAVFEAPTDTEKVYRVVRQGERWMPANQVPNNLPPQLTSFIGRERELDEIQQRLDSVRLVTVLGMGGLGKTRLTLQAAAERMAQYPDGVWFLDLSPIRDPDLVVAEAAQALGVREEPGRPLLQAIVAHLRPRRALLVMDNCEHVLQASADLAAAVLRAAPRVQLLASSRSLLQVPGEQALPILPLPLPDPGDSVVALGRSTAVRLFVERAQAHKPNFALTPREAPAVAELVARLEGIPLALELAAARVRMLSVADINLRLKDRYRVLTGGSRVLQERQQTLRALVDWSYDLLDERERCLLGRLSVFMGGFDLAAAEAVCGAEPLDPLDILELLESLVQKSLVMAGEQDDGMRYRMLETIREYAREKLDAAEGASATAAAHAQHYFALAKQANNGLRGVEQAQWVWRVETELDNLRSAMATALAGGVEPVIGVKIAVAMMGFWILRGYAREGRAFVEDALALPAIVESDMAHAHALYVGAALAGTQSDHAEACRMLEQCLVLRRRLGNPLDIAATLSTLSLSRLLGGEPDAADQAEAEALALFTELGNDYGRAIALLHQGQIDTYRGQGAQARDHVDAALALARRMGHQEILAECERMLGQIAFDGGELVECDRRLRRSLQLCRDAGDRRGEASSLGALGLADLYRGEAASARQRLGEALRAMRSLELREELLSSLEVMVALLRHEGRLDDARRVARAAAAARGRLGLRRAPAAQERWRREVQALQAGDHAMTVLSDGQPGDLDDPDLLDLDSAIALAIAATAQEEATA